jgi:hypothetical protein
MPLTGAQRAAIKANAKAKAHEKHVRRAAEAFEEWKKIYADRRAGHAARLQATSSEDVSDGEVMESSAEWNRDQDALQKFQPRKERRPRTTDSSDGDAGAKVAFKGKVNATPSDFVGFGNMISTQEAFSAPAQTGRVPTSTRENTTERPTSASSKSLKRPAPVDAEGLRGSMASVKISKRSSTTASSSSTA